MRFGTYIITYTRIAVIPPLVHNILVFKFAVSATSPLSYSFIMSFSLQPSAIPKTTSQVIHVLIVIFVVDFEPLCITMTPTGNTDARYSTSNYVQGNVYFVNNNIHGRKLTLPYYAACADCVTVLLSSGSNADLGAVLSRRHNIIPPAGG